MAKRAKVIEVVSDGSEKFLVELIERFSVKRAIEWLRIKFPSFDTSRAEALACDATKNEKEYFAAAELLGYVTRLPEGGGRGATALPAGGTRSVASDDTNKPLLVAAIKMRKDLTERTSRLVQFNYAKKLLQNAIVQGAQGVSGLPSQGLFFFYDRDGYFRLSLVTGEVEKRRFKYNEAKRQSFYIEPNAANNIVKRRLTPPIRTFSDLKGVFSVEQLTKEFYTKLFDWYTWAMSSEVNVHFPNDIADKTDDRKYNNEAIIRMITRLMFTWFIRQRKLVPDVLFDREGLKDVLKHFEPGSMEQDNYYRAILQNLFFATFNCQPDKRRFIHTFQGKSDERHVTTLYRYEREFREAESFKRLIRKVPFLNCALFDCLDKIERPEDGGRELYFDGFSGQGLKYQAFVPNGLFFDDERGIINLFNLYEFTVNENNADDSDVALDPELLGKVFENLLGAFNPETQETARNATGSFYTPREIVDYMVEESLKSYLRSRLKGEVEGGGGRGATALPDGRATSMTSPRTDGRARAPREPLDAKLDDLFDRNKAAEGAETLFSLKEREAILQALYNCKILDPACGSGAFPMGILHCMVRLLSRLDPQCLSIREQLLARYKEDKATVDPTETAAERQERLEELESRLKEGQHYPDYERKLYLIENCIYGVDIQPIATQISKLRFFISLLCDQLRSSYDPDAENFGLLSLPNLEAKFVCANTLIALPDIEGELKIGDVEQLRKELQSNRHKIFRARSTRTKEKYKARDLEIRDTIRQSVYDAKTKPDEDVIEKCRAEIEDAKKRREAVAAPDWYEEYELVQADLFAVHEAKLVKKDRNQSAREKIDAEIAWAEQKIKDELKKAEKSNVTAATQYAQMVAGWDPYDQNASSKFFDAEWMFNIKDGFDVAIGNPPYVLIGKDEYADKYSPFFRYQSGKIDLYRLFMEKAFSSLAKQGYSIVSYITPNTFLGIPSCRALREYLLKQSTMLRIVNFASDVFDGACVNSVVFVASTVLPNERSLITISPKGDFSESYVIRQNDCLNNEDMTIRIFENQQVSKVLNRLRSDCVTIGDSSLDICLGEQPYHNTIHTKKQMEERFLHSDRPINKNYLQELGGRDIFRYYVRRDRKIYLDYSAELYTKPPISYFSGQRLILREIPSETLICALATEKFLVNKSCYVIKVPKNSAWSYEELLAILNSKVVGFWIANTGEKTKQNLFPRIAMASIRRIPLPKLGDDAIIALVEKILAAKNQDPDADTSAWESQIDRLVYKIYGLTEEEIAVVEGRGEKVKVKGEGEENGGSGAAGVRALPRRRVASGARGASALPRREAAEVEEELE